MAIVLPVEMQTQPNEFWCWAAVASMMSVYYQDKGVAALSQCQVVQKTLDISTCCTTPTPNSCLQLWNLSDALKSVGFNAQSNWTEDLTIISQEIGKNRLLAALMYYKQSGILHYVLINGFDDTVGNEAIYVVDPAGQVGGVSWKIFLDNYNFHDGDSASWKQWILIQF